MSVWSAITWDTARTGGFVAYGLITISIALGLVLSLRWRNVAWPRWATNDLHRYVTLLALIFTGIHTLAIWLDPFMAFGPGEVFVPTLSHYRPLWVALGIIASYLLLAIWLSERIQKRIGYGWWRRLHYLTFGIYGLVTIHGIGTGSDTRTAWALGIYAGSFLLVGSLLVIRLLVPAPHLRPRPRVAALVALAALTAAIWTVVGPLRPGWNALANNGNGSGSRVALAQSSGASLALPFNASLQGTATQLSGGSFGSGSGGAVTVRIDSTLMDGPQGSLRITLQGQPAADGSLAVARTSVAFVPSTNHQLYQGEVVSMEGDRMVASCTGPAGEMIRLDMRLQVDNAGAVTGMVRGS